MCLAVPGKVASWSRREPPFATARIEFGGIGRDVNMQCVPDAQVGDYVLVHAGIAISRIDPDEAQRVLKLLDELTLREEFSGEAAAESSAQSPSRAETTRGDTQL